MEIIFLIRKRQLLHTVAGRYIDLSSFFTNCRLW